MNEKRDVVNRIIADDAALIDWLVAVARDTPDVYVRVPEGGACAATLLRDELGIDSIGRLCVFYAVVDALGVDAEETAVEGWATVGDVLAFIRARAS